MIQTYSEAVQYLYKNLPIFQRVGAVAYRADLHNTLGLCAELGDPHKKFKSIHVGGTNGKGSTSHMLASVLQSSGYKTGLYTSPHLKEFTERIRINGEEVTQQFVIDFVNRIIPAIERLKPSFFEITVAMAFEYFAQQQVDFAVIEVGLGGRLDSTNVITPMLSVITNIGWDHKDILGNTLEEIAKEKAGIIKEGIPVIVGERQGMLQQIFDEKAKASGSELMVASDLFEAVQINRHHQYYYEVLKGGDVFMSHVKLPLEGFYQQKNLATVVAATQFLTKAGLQITSDSLRHGLELVVEQTNLKGRWQRLAEAPLMICDTAHNLDGVQAAVNQIRQQRARHIHMVWGMVRDKDVSEVLSILPAEATYYFCQAKIPRAMDAVVLAEKGKTFGLNGAAIPDVNDAIRQALVNAMENDLIFIGGSTFVVAEINGL